MGILLKPAEALLGLALIKYPIRRNLSFLRVPPYLCKGISKI
ncbi:hypothetical protein SPBRAN_428 [uncultured Candidatus Thioglobus sp.]|nr:hypothetical protein SPBRAN_428 [uncultured Candidatus Thioglobus sp.]